MRPHPGSSAPHRFAPIVFALLATLAVPPAHAAWQPGGTLLVPLTSQGYQEWSSIVSNGSGGAFVTWTNSFTYPGTDYTEYKLWAQQVDVNGNVPAPWPTTGVVVRAWSLAPGSTGPVITPLQMLEDGSGAIAPEMSAENIVEYRNRFHLYRIASDGAVTGVPGYSGIYTGPDVTGVQVDVDGAGGVVMMAIQQTFGLPPGGGGAGDLYAQRVDPLGNALWDPPPVFCNSSILGGGWDVLADGAGGGFFAWCEKAAGGTRELFIQHLDGIGAVTPGWPADGRLVRGGMGAVNRVMLTSDGAGGAIVVWCDERNGEPHLYAHHVSADGSVDPVIPANGRALASGNLNDDFSSVVSDGQAGAYVIRFSHDNFSNQQVRLYHLDPAMMPHAGWPAEGRLMPGGCAIAPDGLGGTFLAFTTGPYPYDLVAQHLAGDGSPAPGWTGIGYELTESVASYGIVRSDAGAIVAWIDGNGPNGPGIYAQRLVPDGPVAVQLSLVAATAEPSHVSLHWYATAAAMLAATVERRTDETEWVALGTVSADGAGHLRYEDGSVTGGRFGYRVTWTEDGAVRHGGETWVDVPDAWRLALSAPRPNPGSGPAAFALTLAAPAPASIELLDLQGRRIAHRDLGTLGAGRHLITIDEAATLAPGVYLARLSQGIDTRTVRMIRFR